MTRTMASPSSSTSSPPPEPLPPPPAAAQAASPAAAQAAVPSITLKITKSDAERFLEASQALESSLQDVLQQQQQEDDNHGEEEEQQQQQLLLHETLYKAAQTCQHPLVVAFLDRMACSGIPTLENKAGVLLFHDSDKTAKLRHLFRAFGRRTMRNDGNGEDSQQQQHSENEDSKSSSCLYLLDQAGALSLFRSVLTSLSCCVHTPSSNSGSSSAADQQKHVVFVEGQPASPHRDDDNDDEHLRRPTKRAKREMDGDTATTHPLSEDDEATSTGAALVPSSSTSPASAVKQESQDSTTTQLQHEHTVSASSFDSSLATLRDEDHETAASTITTTAASSSLAAAAALPESLRREIEAIATYAAEELLRYNASVTAATTTAVHENEQDEAESSSLVAFGTFGDWYNSASGSSVVPWLELLQLNKWRKHAGQRRTTTTKASSSFAPTNDDNKAHLESSSDNACGGDHHDHPPGSPGSLTMEDDSSSPSLISFDFSGASENSHSPSNDNNGTSPSHHSSPSALCINISEDNLLALKELVHGTGLSQRPAADVCKTLLALAVKHNTSNVAGDDEDAPSLLTLSRSDFERAIGHLIPEACMNQLNTLERDSVYQSLLDFFWLYQGSSATTGDGIAEDSVDLQELAVGICFFCAGNKSTKLSTGFELIDDKRRGFLSEEQLLGYLRSYLLALVALSFFKPLSKQNQRRVISPQRRASIRAAIESGAKWTLAHFLGYLGGGSSDRKNAVSFESFAHWYSTGGYNIAPWLELLDLNKVFSLLNNSNDPTTEASPLPLIPSFPPTSFQTTARRPAPPRDRMSSLRRHHSSLHGQPPPEILFSFPLANRRSLVVLKEDATYVREVVEQLGLLSMTPDSLWSALSKSVEKRRNKKAQKDEVAVYVNSASFVQCMQDACPQAGRKRSSPGNNNSSLRHSIPELLSNFFHCFDIDQVDSVALDELMGGLTLLCGGKKSMKLSFAFGIFDTRPGIQKKKKKEGVVDSLSGEDLFLFLRSILIVTFSCCRQSLDMSDDTVSRCIADTANLICNDVMRHQWETKHTDRLNFDEFGQWYNEGGFERAPWLELLDLTKWVLVDNIDAIEKRDPGGAMTHPPAPVQVIPPPPPEDSLDPAFFDENGIMPMDSMDEMDMMLMPQPSSERELDADGLRIQKSFSFSPSHRQEDSHHPSPPALTFRMINNEEHGGYIMSFSAARIDHLRRILDESGITRVKVEDACNAILSKASRSSGEGKNDPKLSKSNYDSAVKGILQWKSGTSSESKRTLSRLFDEIYAAFVGEGTGRPSVIDVACGLTVLCQGKKSDKLEFAFEVLDKNKRGQLSKQEMTKYLQSFLTVLLCIAFSPALVHDPALDTVSTMNGSHCDGSAATMNRAIRSGAKWAASIAFREFNGRTLMSFDDFADWYTSKGFCNIPWLELIDLSKWIMTS